METIALASDHAGFALKSHLLQVLKKEGLEVLDLGPTTEDRVDYPDFAHKMAVAIQNGDAAKGILVCGTGIGISMAANRFEGIRAAVVSDGFSAEMTRRHNDANVLCLGSRVVGEGQAEYLMNLFLKTPFEGGRHTGRVEKIDSNCK